MCRREKRDNDTFIMVKEYISSSELRQPPLLVLREEDKATFALTTDRNMDYLATSLCSYVIFVFFIFYNQYPTTTNIRFKFPKEKDSYSRL